MIVLRYRAQYSTYLRYRGPSGICRLDLEGELTAARQNLVEEMQSAVERYYNINKILMSKLGGWPTQSKFMKILLPTIVASFIFSIGFLEVKSRRFLLSV